MIEIRFVEYTKEQLNAMRSHVYKPVELNWGYTKKDKAKKRSR